MVTIRGRCQGTIQRNQQCPRQDIAPLYQRWDHLLWALNPQEALLQPRGGNPNLL